MKKAHFDTAPPATVDHHKKFAHTKEAPKERPLRPLVPEAEPAKPSPAQAAPAAPKAVKAAAAAIMTALLFLLLGNSALAQYNTNPPSIVLIPGGQYNSPPAPGPTVLTVGVAGQYPTITSAKAAATNGNTIVVYPGTYTENNLLKLGVNYYFYPGAKLSYIDSITNGSGAYQPGYGFFDDRATGATTNRIRGHVSFYFSCGTNNPFGDCQGNTNAVGALVLTNPASEITLEFGRADGDGFVTCATAAVNGSQPGPALFYISACRRAFISGDDIALTAPLGSVNSNPNVLNGLYWESGDTYVNVRHIGPFNNYAIWPNQGTAVGGQLWVSAQNCEGYIYQSASSSSFKSWFTFESLVVTNSISVSAFGVFGGYSYLTANKVADLDANGTGLVCQNGTTWATVQKITANGTGSWAKTIGSGATLYLSGQHYEYTDSNGDAVGFVNNSSGTTLRVFGGAGATAGVGINHSAAGTSILSGVSLDSSSGTKATAVSGAAGLSLKGCTLLCASSTNSISATSGQTVGTYWSVGNYTNTANITLSPNAGWTINSAAK